MPKLGPIKRAELIRLFRVLGFHGPYAGACVPNPHQSDISTGLLGRILRQAGVEREEWEDL